MCSFYLQEDGTWTDIPRCIEHDPGVEEQIPGLCPAIPGYCSDGYLGQQGIIEFASKSVKMLQFSELKI